MKHTHTDFRKELHFLADIFVLTGVFASTWVFPNWRLFFLFAWCIKVCMKTNHSWFNYTKSEKKKYCHIMAIDGQYHFRLAEDQTVVIIDLSEAWFLIFCRIYVACFVNWWSTLYTHCRKQSMSQQCYEMLRFSELYKTIFLPVLL